MFRAALFDAINTAKNTAGITDPLYYTVPAGESGPYYLMEVVSDLEAPQQLCLGNNQAGVLLAQFSYNEPQQASGDGAMNQRIEAKLDAFKNVVKDIEGTVTFDGTSYTVWENRTEGVRRISEPSINYYFTIFESNFSWNIGE